MKVLSFLRCGAVIALSLIAGRAGAQLDSNAKVMLYLHPTIAECYDMAIDHPAGVPSAYANPLESVSFDTSLRFPASDSIYCTSGFEQAFLIVDTISKCFRHLAFSSNNPLYNWPVPCAEWFGVEEASIYFQMSLDSLPYTDSVGIISVSGVFDFSSSISSQYSCRCGDEMWSGSYLDSEILRDSLSIEIVPKDYLSVSQPETIAETRSLAIMEQGTEALLCTFSSSEYPRTLEIYDLLGRKASIILIPGSAEFVELPIASLPPGCYFARLGDQVAKFVVPPR